MTSNVGLTTPRGSGTSGYVQRNLSALKPSQLNKARAGAGAPYSAIDAQASKYRQRQPDKEILEHDRKRQVEIEVFELRDRLEDEGVDEDKIDDQCSALRKKLLAGGSAEDAEGRRGRNTKETSEREHWNRKRREVKNLKGWQTHELAEAKIDEMERFRRAVGISAEYQEGGHWKEKEERAKKREEQAAAAAQQAKDESDSS